MANCALVYDAETRRASELAQALRDAGVSATVAADFEEALALVREQGYDLVVSSGNGSKAENPFQLVLAAKRDGDCSPAIILTLPRGSAVGAAGALSLAATVQRTAPEVPRVLRRADIVLDRVSHEVTFRGTPLALTPHEYRILECLVATEGLVTRDQMGRAAWGRLPAKSNALDVHLGNLRRKLHAVSGQRLIRTARGLGFSLDPAHGKPAGDTRGSVHPERN